VRYPVAVFCIRGSRHEAAKVHKSRPCAGASVINAVRLDSRSSVLRIRLPGVRYPVAVLCIRGSRHEDAKVHKSPALCRGLRNECGEIG
jgi:hypothetical protein